jgi:hypothetical protein
MPGLVKIGMTKRNPNIRAKELASQTGIPTKFKVEHAVKVSDSLSVEQSIHKKLKKYRVNNNREFFEIDISKAIKEVDKESKKYMTGKFSKKSFLSDVITAGILTAIGYYALDYFFDFRIKKEYLLMYTTYLNVFL